jgi:hypothetical protein
MIDSRMTAAVLLAAAIASNALTGPTAEAAEGRAIRCARVVASARARIVASDTRRLHRCALAIIAPDAIEDVEANCRLLRTPGTGVDATDARARRRIARRCKTELPPWRPTVCRGPGFPVRELLDDGQTLADCTIASSHCLALQSVGGLYADVVGILAAENPMNLAFEYSGVPGNSFADCIGTVPVSTTSTLPPATTSTTLPEPTTTLPAPTTTLPEPTTTLPAPTTTLPEPTTTLPAPTTTLPEPTTTLPAPTTTLPQPTTTVPTPTTTLPSPTTTLPSDGVPELLVTEIMSNPDAQSDSAGEYFEVFNAGSGTVDLSGLTVSDLGSNAFTVDTGPVLAPGQYAVFGKTASAAGGAVDYVYGSAMSLTNSGDDVILSIGATVIDQVSYDASWPLAAGQAMELAPSAYDTLANDDAANWCLATTDLGDGDLGSPHGAGSGCSP